MDSRDITSQQASEIYSHVRESLHYLASLQQRMDERQFSHEDRLYLEVQAARYAVKLLANDLHRMACGPSYGGDQRG
jgi:hypothetical protein